MQTSENSLLLKASRRGRERHPKAKCSRFYFRQPVGSGSDEAIQR